MNTTTRINLWSSPRNVSTALMYSFAQRVDTTVVDEPLYAYYLHKSKAEHPGQVAILAAMESDLNKLVDSVLLKPYETPIVFFKQMTHHLFERDYDFLQPFKNIIFIRNPRLIIRSYAKVIKTISMQDIGIKQQVELLEVLDNPIVLDSKNLLKNPEACLQKLCSSLEIPYTKNMLQWPSGARKEDGVWAKYWYANVHASTCFNAYEETDFDLGPEHETLAENCRPYYKKLLAYSL